MGNFYTNYTLRGPTQHAVAAVLAGRRAMVTPSQNDCVVVFDEVSELQDHELIADLATKLSREFSCPVLAVLNHDDDILWYQLYLGGKLADEYNSNPGCFDSSTPPPSSRGGDASILCQAFGATNIAKVERVLRTSAFAEDGYAFAFEQHADLVRALQISEYAVGTGYMSFRYNEYPEGLSAGDLLNTMDLPSSPTLGNK
jgi:hypothetical protein